MWVGSSGRGKGVQQKLWLNIDSAAAAGLLKIPPPPPILVACVWSGSGRRRVLSKQELGTRTRGGRAQMSRRTTRDWFNIRGVRWQRCHRSHHNKCHHSHHNSCPRCDHKSYHNSHCYRNHHQDNCRHHSFMPQIINNKIIKIFSSSIPLSHLVPSSQIMPIFFFFVFRALQQLLPWHSPWQAVSRTCFLAC